ncbi:MAG: Ig-like domain-containing protein [Clostridia bacterium]|nr:Ig-like domain-containing protein [Clostridia bacterium]
MQMDPAIINVKDSAFIKELYGGGEGVENCYVKFTSGITQYKNENGRAIAAIVSTVSSQNGEAVIKNCVGIMDLSGGVTHPATPFGGAASIVGGVKWNNSTVNIENCYGAVLVKEGDAVHTPKLNSQDTSGYSVTEGYEEVTPVYNEETSAAYATVAEVYAAAKTGMTAANGWNEYWTVDAENGWLKFNEQYIYVANAPALNEAEVQLFAVKDTNLNKVAASVELSVANAIGAVSYVSSNEEVATVDANGKVTAVGAGTTTVTASCGGYEMTCEVSVKNYYEISNAADFAATLMTTAANSKLTADYYYALTTDIDFGNNIINTTAGYQTVGWDGVTTGYDGDAYTIFAGTFDGFGHTVTMTASSNLGTATGNAGFACLFGKVTGTIKNLGFVMTAKVLGVTQARLCGMAAMLTDGATVSNCYSSVASPYYSNGNYPVAPIASYVSSTNIATPVTIENCVGVLQDITTNRSSGFASGLIGRVDGSGTVYINNCYAVEIDPADTTAGTPEVYDSNGTSWKVPTVTNTNAYLTVAAMFDAAKTGLTKANGWNGYWTVDGTTGTLKFGSTVIYQA